ncbi:MAG TPA: protein-glutamate O-methyltransferase [Blastocatellia bacterium]|nr:protein-glutamate O-methyltransferase [Blastocatellia bacterium]
MITASQDTSMLLQSISDREFALFQVLIHRESGILLSPVKKAMLVGRLNKRLRDLGLNSFSAYYRRIVEGDNAERVRMIDCICTNETRFFREPGHFDFLEQHVFPEWASGHARTIRVWSAGCSTGEEPYSLAMTLLHHFPTSAGWDIEIIGTDLSTRALERARAAVWPLEKAREIPLGYRKVFMLRGTRSQEGKMKAGLDIRSVIKFQHLNLVDEAYTVTGLFDLIFCRNVMIYFDPQNKVRVVDRLLNHLAQRGYLFLGHAESLTGMTDRVRGVGPMVYRRIE